MKKRSIKKVVFRTLLIAVLAGVFTALFVSLAGCKKVLGPKLGDGATYEGKNYNIYVCDVDGSVTIDWTGYTTASSFKSEVEAATVSENSCEGVVSAKDGKLTVSASKTGSIRLAIKISVPDKPNYYWFTTTDVKFCTRKDVTSAEELQNMTDPYAHYVLTADLDLSGTEWKPYAFDGWFDGDGHTVKGLSYTGKSGDNNVGLFSSNSGYIENVTLRDCAVGVDGSSECVGMLVGKNTGKVVNVTIADGTVNAPDSDFVGGVIGCQLGISESVKSSATVTGCRGVGGVFGDIITRTNRLQIAPVNEGKVSGYEWVGGVAGGASDALMLEYDLVTIVSPVNAGAVEGSYYVGGIIGYAVPTGFYHGNTAGKGGDNSYTVKMNITVSDATNRGDVSGVDYVGGIAGHFESSDTTGIQGTSVNEGAITGTYYVGGFFGKTSGFIVKNLTNTQTVTGRGYVGGIAGYMGAGENCVNDGTVKAQNRYYDGYVYAGGIAGESGALTACENKGTVESVYGDDVGGVVGYVASELKTCVNSGAVKTTDVGVAVGGVAGKLKGGQATDCSNVGSVNADQSVGGVVGAMDGSTGTNLKNSGAVDGKSNVGGVIGNVMNGATLNGGVNEGERVNGGDATGGVVGFLSGASVILTDLSSSAEVNGKDGVGGVVGACDEKVIVSLDGAQCSAAAVTGEKYVGGVVGNGRNMKLSNSLIPRTVVSGAQYVGGIAGKAYSVSSGTFRGTLSVAAAPADSDYSVYAGGIAGELVYADNCVNYSDVTVEGHALYVGGVVGRLIGSKDAKTNISASNTNRGAVTGYRYVGGIAGTIDRALLDRCINDGAITGTQNVGGIAGAADAITQVKACSNTGTVKADSFAAGIFGSKTGGSNITGCNNTGTIDCSSNLGQIYVGD